MESDDDEWNVETNPMITFRREPFLAEQVAAYLDDLDDESLLPAA